MEVGVGRTGRVLKGAVKDAVRRLPASVRPARARSWDDWAIAIVDTDDPLSLRAADVAAPTISHRDVPGADFVADPFLLRHDGRWWCLFEQLDRATDRGTLGACVEESPGDWRYVGRVLEEPFHLSYPQPLEHEGELLLLPETGDAGEVRLYRATDGPRRFELDTVLLSGAAFHDATVHRDATGWWLFVEVSDGPGFDTLRLYRADDLRGPWVEHPASPVVDRDPRIARPGGPLLAVDGTTYRVTQDCAGDYGLGLHAVPVDELSLAAYREGEPRPLLAPHGVGWAARGVHHLHAVPRPEGGWRVAFDGR